MKTLVMSGAITGSFAGSYIPLLWGGSVFSLSSIFFAALFGLLGIWGGYWLGNRFL